MPPFDSTSTGPGPGTSLSNIRADEIIQAPSAINVPENIRYEDAVVLPPDLNDDIITVSIQDDDLPDMVLKGVLLGLSEEQQALRGVRINKEKEGKDITNVAMKRSTILKFMSETLIQRQALVGGSGEIDVRGPKFREVVKMFLQMIQDAMDDANIAQENKDIFFNDLKLRLDGWEAKAEKILKSTTFR